MIYILCLRRPQRDKPLRTSLERIQHQNPLPSSKNYQMKRPKYTPPKSTPRFGRCTSTEHLEPFHVQDWWPGLGSSSFRPKTTSSRAHSPSPHLAPTMLQNTTLCSLVCNWHPGLGQGSSNSELVVNQLRGEYEVRSDDLIPYFDSAQQMAEQFEGFYKGHVPRQDNTHADALAG